MTHVIDAWGRIKEYWGEVALVDLADYGQGRLIYGGAADWQVLAHPGAANRVLQSTAAELGWSAQAVTFPAAGAVPVGTGANTQVTYWTGANTLAGDAGMTYAPGTDTLSVGNVIVPHLGYTGLGPAAGRLVFDDGVPDEARFEDCGYVGIENILYHIGDADTYLIFSPDFAGFRVGNVDFLYMSEHVALQDYFDVNPGTVDIDFYARAVGVVDALFVRGSDGQITLGVLGAGAVQSTAGGVLSSGALPLTDLASYTQGDLIYGGAGDWQDLAHPGAANRVLQSTVAEVGWSAQAVTFPAAGAVPVGTAGANQVAYWTGVNALAGDAGLMVDAANDMFIVADGGGIGNAIATARLIFDSSGATDYASVMGANLGIRTLAPGADLQVGSNRPILGNGLLGRIEIRGDAGGWALLYGFQGSAGTARGGFWSLGSGDALTYWSIGSAYDDGIFVVLPGGNVGFGTVMPDRLTHAEASDAVTAAITYAQRLSHVLSAGVAAPLMGVMTEYELEDAGGNPQVTGELGALWATATAGAESPLFRGTTYPIGVAGPGYWGFWTWDDLDNNARTAVPNGAGDVVRGIRMMYTIYVNAAAAFAAAEVTLIPGGAAHDMYNVAGDQFTLTCNADGSVTVVRAAGADTADVGLLMLWIS